MSHDTDLIEAISDLTRELHLCREDKKNEFEWLKSHPALATKHDLKELENKIMSAITDWAATEQADLTAISTTLDTVVSGIAALDTLITNLQNSPGTLSAADQAALDAIKAASTALVAKSGAISVAPPVVPVPPAPAVKPAA